MVLEVSNVLQHTFFNPIHSESRKPQRVFFDGCLAWTSNTQLTGCPVRTENGGSELWFTCRGKNCTCLTEHCSTCVKGLPQCQFLSRLPLTMLSSGIGNFHLPPHLPWAIGSMRLARNAVGVLISVPQSFTWQCPCSHVSWKWAECACARRSFFHLKSPLILPFQNWACVRYARKFCSLMHRDTVLASFWGFLKSVQI